MSGMKTTLLAAIAVLALVAAAPSPGPTDQRVFELRTYHTPPGKLDARGPVLLRRRNAREPELPGDVHADRASSATSSAAAPAAASSSACSGEAVCAVSPGDGRITAAAVRRAAGRAVRPGRTGSAVCA